MVTQAELDKYFVSINKALRSYSGEKRHVIEALRSDVEEYLLEFPDASFENLVSRFGDPDSIAKEYIHGIPVDEIGARLNSAKFNKKAVLIALVVIVGLVLAFLCTTIFVMWDRSSQCYFDDITAAVNLFVMKEM